MAYAHGTHDDWRNILAGVEGRTHRGEGESLGERQQAPRPQNTMDAARRHGYDSNFELAWARFAGEGGGDTPRAPALDAAMLFGWIVTCILFGAAVVVVAMH